MHTIITTYEPRIQRVAALAIACITVSAFMYGFFLLGAVSHTATRTKEESAVRTLRTEVSEMQMQYLTLTRAITMERAEVLGFVAPQNLSTIFATAAERQLTFRKP